MTYIKHFTAPFYIPRVQTWKIMYIHKHILHSSSGFNAHYLLLLNVIHLGNL